jgi:phosphonate transport system permease protein
MVGGSTWRRRTQRQDLLIWLGWFLGVLVVVQCWQVIARVTIWDFVWDAPTQAGDLISRMVPPRWEYAAKLWRPLWDTIAIATLGTALAIVIAVPIAYLAARNTTPSLLLVRPVALFLIVASRSINALIWALLLVSMLGPGMLAGILAIALRSIGFVAKLLYEGIEEIDATQVEAIRATGAGAGQTVTYGIVPQVTPVFAGVAVFRWDINIRESTVLGLVGAGGIGLELQASISTLAWPQASVIFLLILATVGLSEWLSARIRHAII